MAGSATKLIAPNKVVPDTETPTVNGKLRGGTLRVSNGSIEGAVQEGQEDRRHHDDRDDNPAGLRAGAYLQMWNKTLTAALKAFVELFVVQKYAGTPRPAEP